MNDIANQEQLEAEQSRHETQGRYNVQFAAQKLAQHIYDTGVTQASFEENIGAFKYTITVVKHE